MAGVEGQNVGVGKMTGVETKKAEEEKLKWLQEVPVKIFMNVFSATVANCVGVINRNSFTTFKALDDEVKAIVKKNWEVQLPNVSAEHYIITYAGGHPMRKLDMAKLGWARFQNRLAEAHFYAPGSVMELDDMDEEED